MKKLIIGFMLVISVVSFSKEYSIYIKKSDPTIIAPTANNPYYSLYFDGKGYYDISIKGGTNEYTDWDRSYFERDKIIKGVFLKALLNGKTLVITDEFDHTFITEFTLTKSEQKSLRKIISITNKDKGDYVK